MKSKKQISIIFSIIFILTLLPTMVLAQVETTDSTEVTETVVPATVKDTSVAQQLKEKRAQLERLRTEKMIEQQDKKETQIMELQNRKEEKTAELKDKMEARKSELLSKKQEIYTKRVENNKQFVLKHIERARDLINKFMERVNLFKENGKEVPSSVEADFIVAFNILSGIESKVNAVDSTSNATTLEELKEEYTNTKSTFEELRLDFKDVKTVLEGVLSSLKFVKLTGSNSTDGGN